MEKTGREDLPVLIVIGHSGLVQSDRVLGAVSDPFGYPLVLSFLCEKLSLNSALPEARVVYAEPQGLMGAVT